MIVNPYGHEDGRRLLLAWIPPPQAHDFHGSIETIDNMVERKSLGSWETRFELCDKNSLKSLTMLLSCFLFPMFMNEAPTVRSHTYDIFPPNCFFQLIIDNSNFSSREKEMKPERW